jgi:histidinol-phosphate aminotransferase
MINKFINQHILDLKKYDPVDSDKKLAEEFGLKEKDIIRLNANENPYGPWAGIKDSFSKIKFNVYPDSNQDLLRESLSKYTGLDKNQIVAGSGADEMIECIFKIFCNKNDALIDVQPTFGMYSFLADSIGMKVVPFERDLDWTININKLKEEIDINSAKVIFLASPNNPTGNSLSNEDLEEILKMDILVVVDETYFEFYGSTAAEMIKDYENLIILRSFSKWAGIAGLRIGYMLANSEVIDNVFKVKQPYNINVVAEKAAILTLENRIGMQPNIEKILSGKKEFIEFVNNLDNVYAFSSDANFILCKFPKNGGKFIFNKLAREGIFVRSFSNENLKDCLRFTIGTAGQMKKVKEVLKATY